MVSELLKTLEDVKGHWMIGGSALEKVPPSWRAAAEDDPHPDLALLALVGQAMQFALQASPGGDLQSLAPLPRLRLPTPPPQARQQIRHLVQVTKVSESQMAAIIHLLAARGYVTHPLDYMPKRFDQLPDIYAPWAAWQLAGEAHDEAEQFDAINADNWDAWMPAERRVALSHLRRERPEEARQLVAEKAPSLPADERLRIVETLSETLGPEDQSLLEGFASDRSGKVRQLIARLLARIGAVEDEATEVAEYGEFFTAAKKRLRSGYKITPKRLKTKAQRKRRSELAAKLSLRSFVQGLNLASDMELIEGWEHVDDQATDELVRMVAATGSEQAASALASRIASLDGMSAEAFELLLGRLGNQGRRVLLPQVLQNEDASFSSAVVCADGFWGEIPLEQLKPLRALKQLKKLAEEDLSKETVRQEMCRQGLFSLGLLADQAAATEMLALFTNSGLFASDPMLGVLKLNACLPLGEIK